MVYTKILDKNRTYFIYVAPNYNTDLSNVGTKVNIKGLIPENISNNKYYSFLNLNLNEDKFKNRVVFSAKIDNIREDSVILLTQQNLTHNIKFVHKDNNYTQPKILFIKYNITNNVINDNQYLFTPDTNRINLSKINVQDVSLNIQNSTNDVDSTNEDRDVFFKSLSYYFNKYKIYNYTDYFKFKFSDFIDLSYVLEHKNLTKDISYNKLKTVVNNVTLKNNFSDDQTINYDENNFKNLYNFTDDGSLNITHIRPVYKINYNEDIDNSFNNILMYNKFENISTVNVNYKYPRNNDVEGLENDLINIDSYNDVSINFFVLKNVDVKKNNYGKILFNKNYTFFDGKVLGYNNNFYNNSLNHQYKNLYDNSMVFLSLGYGITGLTQNDIFNRVKMDMNTIIKGTIREHKLSKINFSSNVNSNAITTELIKTNKYLLDENYNYNYTNITHNWIKENSTKIIDLSLLEFYESFNYDLSHNIYYNRFGSLDLINNDISANNFVNGALNLDKNNYYDFSYIPKNINYIIKDISDISYSLIYDTKFTFNGKSYPAELNNKNSSLFNTSITDNILKLDFRYNYGKNIDLDMYFTIKYNYDKTFESYSLLDHYNDNLLLNFNKQILSSRIFTTEGSDFTNVDCIFIYHDPYNENTPDEFKYPYNNVEISSNVSIDSLSRAIELLPGAETSVTNSTIIPARNGSNLSRKQIQGYIGFNNIPKLLSIKAYDESIIESRGFVRQFNINDSCKTYADRVKDKINLNTNRDSITKDNKIYSRATNRKQNFASMVRSKGRNNPVTKVCDQTSSIDYDSITNYNTPFKMFRTGRGHYLGPNN